MSNRRCSTEAKTPPVAIARAIVTRPLVLLADEPTGNLDSQRGHEIMDLLVALNREHGITIRMVTHEPDMARYARRVVRFVDGLVESDHRQAEKNDVVQPPKHNTLQGMCDGCP